MTLPCLYKNMHTEGRTNWLLTVAVQVFDYRLARLNEPYQPNFAAGSPGTHQHWPSSLSAR
jgi:hypothetical protein